MIDRQQVRRKPVALLAFLSLLIATVFSAVMIPAASAATVPVLNLTGVVLAPGGVPITGNVQETQAFELHLTFDLADSVMPGDQFTIAFPQEVEAYTTPIPVKILGPNNEEVGSCVISGASVTCTLGEFVRGRDGFKDFKFFFGMTAVDDNDGEESLPLTVNGGQPVLIDLPGEGGIVGSGGYPFPTKVKKEGWVYLRDTGQLEWRVWLPVTAGQNTITLTDDLKDGMTWVQSPDSYYADYWTLPAADWNADNPWDGSDKRIPAANLAWVPKAGNTGFTLNIDVPTGATVILLSYRSQLPPGVEFNQVFHNSLSGSYTVENATATYQYRAGASGNGNQIPDLVIKKAVVGTAPADATYVVQVACVDPQGVALPNSPFERTISVATPATVLDIPVGTRCTVTETSTGGAVAVSYVPVGGVVTMVGTTEPVEVVVTNDFTPPLPVLGDFSIMKSVEGEQAAVDLVGTQSFTVKYTIGNAPEAEFTIEHGQIKVFEDLPVGTVVKFSEVTPVKEGVVFGTPSFLANGQAVSEITIGANTSVDVKLTNPVSLPPVGGFSVTKQVEGPKAAVDLVGTKSFTVNYTVDGEAAATPLTVTNGSTATVEGLPAGAVVKLTEVTPTQDGVIFGTPVFTADGAPVTEITIGDDTVVAVTLTNPVEPVTVRTPPPSSPPVTPPVTTPPVTTPPTTPVTTPVVTPSKKPVKQLPSTGVDGPGLPAAGGPGGVPGGAGVWMGRRRNNA